MVYPVLSDTLIAFQVAWITHAGSSKLEKKIAIRPTSGKATLSGITISERH